MIRCECLGTLFRLPPTPEDNLPHVTPAMLYDLLAEFDILHRPEAARRTFHWLSIVSPDDPAGALLETVSDARTLFLCNAPDAASFLDERPCAFALVRLDENEGIEALDGYRGRMIAVQAKEPLAYLAAILQSFFIRMLVWEGDLERIALRKGTLGDMLDASVPMIGNFIFVSDNNFNVIAQTSAIDPPDDLHRKIIENGCLTPRTINEERFRLPERTFYTRKASDIASYDRVSCPVHINHSYFGSISMSCNAAPDTEGLRDLFRILVQRMIPVCEEVWKEQVHLNIPSCFFFTELIERKRLGEAYIKDQMELLHLEEMGHFKLVLIDVDEGVDPGLAALAAKAASGINGGHSYCFPYHDHLLALLYDASADGRLSHRRTALELEERLFQPHGIACGISSVFFDITNLDLAYRQAKMALGFRKSIDQEQFGSGEKRVEGVYLFEDALLYYLVDPTGKDERFLTFCFSQSIVSILHREDQSNDTSYLPLLWFYLQSERNATEVAKRLHVHRNTVLYHIEKIQHRFDFDLSSKAARDWLLLSFKWLFMQLSSESLNKIFHDTE